MTAEQITEELQNLPEEQKLDFASYLDNEGIGYALWDGSFNGLSPELMKPLNNLRLCIKDLLIS